MVLASVVLHTGVTANLSIVMILFASVVLHGVTADFASHDISHDIIGLGGSAWCNC